MITTINSGNIFEPAAAYVALSRATSQGALYLIDFDRAVVVAFGSVCAFYKRLRAFSHAYDVLLESVQMAFAMGCCRKQSPPTKRGAQHRQINIQPAPKRARNNTVETAIVLGDDELHQLGPPTTDFAGDDDVVLMETWPVTPEKQAVPRSRQMTPVKRKLLEKPMKREGKVWIVEDKDQQIEAIVQGED